MSDVGVLLFARVVEAQAQIFGMAAENAARLHRGEAPAYPERAFLAVADKIETAIKEAGA